LFGATSFRLQDASFPGGQLLAAYGMQLAA